MLHARFDSTPVFDALMHSAQGCGDDGAYSVELENLARVEQSYDAGTAIVRTRLWDTGPRRGTRRLRAALHHARPAAPARATGASCAAHCWAPTGPIRRAPARRLGLATPSITRGSHHLRYVLPDITLRLTTNVPLTYLVDGTWIALHRPVSLLLGPDETLDDGIEETARSFQEQTELYWRHWTHRLALPLEWQDAVIRAAITLKLCQYEETGAIVAAMTTSIP